MLFHAIEGHSKYYGRKLNYDKCINISANQSISSVRFPPTGPAAGQLLKKRAAVYLGSLLTDSRDNKAEIINRLEDCIATANRMKLFWLRANTTVKWKIQVSNAIVRWKLLYGLECIQLTKAEISQCFSKQIPQTYFPTTPYIHRSKTTNEPMYEEIRNQYGRVFEDFGTTWKKAKMRLFGQVVRSSPADPMNQVTLDGDNLRPRPVHTRRTGRPEVYWVLESYKLYKDAYSIINGEGATAFNVNDLGHLQQV